MSVAEEWGNTREAAQATSADLSCRRRPRPSRLLLLSFRLCCRRSKAPRRARGGARLRGEAETTLFLSAERMLECKNGERRSAQRENPARQSSSAFHRGARRRRYGRSPAGCGVLRCSLCSFAFLMRSDCVRGYETSVISQTSGRNMRIGRAGAWGVCSALHLLHAAPCIDIIRGQKFPDLPNAQLLQIESHSSFARFGDTPKK